MYIKVVIKVIIILVIFWR